MNTEKSLDKILGNRCMACAHFSHENFKLGDRLEEGRKLQHGICAPGYCLKLNDCVSGRLPSCGKFVLAGRNDRKTPDQALEEIESDQLQEHNT